MSGMHVVIIGAGTGGLCLAHGLLKAGISVAVYERDRTRADGLQGYRVGISPDGSRALKACLPEALFQTFVATCASGPRYFNIMRARDFKELLCQPVPRDDDDPMNNEQSVSRMTLRQVLLTGLEGVVHFDKALERYEMVGDKVVARFTDGSTATGDLLVGADGSNSAVRRQYLPHARLDDCGIRAIAGKIPLTPETRALLSESVQQGVTLGFGPGGHSIILHVMEFKWDRGGVKPTVAEADRTLLESWPGLLYDNTRDYVLWAFSAPRRHFPRDPMQGTQAEQLALAREMTASWAPVVRQLAENIDVSTVFPVAVRTSVPVPAWTPSRVTLLGDAIHTMTPGRGVGPTRRCGMRSTCCGRLRRWSEETSRFWPQWEPTRRRCAPTAMRRSRSRASRRTTPTFCTSPT